MRAERIIRSTFDRAKPLPRRMTIVSGETCTSEEAYVLLIIAIADRPKQDRRQTVGIERLHGMTRRLQEGTAAMPGSWDSSSVHLAQVRE